MITQILIELMTEKFRTFTVTAYHQGHNDEKNNYAFWGVTHKGENVRHARGSVENLFLAAIGQEPQKVCATCKLTRPVESFNLKKSNKTKREESCRRCKEDARLAAAAKRAKKVKEKALSKKANTPG